MLEAVEGNIHQRLCALLDEHRARYRVMAHACVFGAIPPFSFHPALRLVADPLLFERFPQIAFNAGRLDRSIILDTEDYLYIARPEIATFRRLS